MPALTPTNPLFVKTCLLKLNDVVKLQVCKLMQNSMTGLDTGHKSFTLAGSLHSHNTRLFKVLNFKTEKTRSRLDLNSFRYLGPNPKFWSSVIKNLKKN